MPNTFLRIAIAPRPRNLSSFAANSNTIYTIIILRIIAIMMFSLWNSDFKESTVVNDPAPAISGNAMGTIEADEEEISLWISIPKIISRAMIKSTNEPATAKDGTSIPTNFKMEFPRNRKEINKIPATIVAFSDCIFPNLFFNETIIGMLPGISITANRTKNAVRISLYEKWKFTEIFLQKYAFRNYSFWIIE